MNKQRLLLFSAKYFLALTIATAAAAHAGTTAQLTLTGAPAPSAAVGKNYQFKPNVTGLSRRRPQFQIKNKPAWAQFSSSNGMLYGKPKAAGKWPGIMISATDGQRRAALKAFTITCKGTSAATALSITGSPSTTATIGVAYNFQPSVAAPSGSILNFTIINRPSWASFDASRGTLSGTPTASGAFSNITITVHNGAASDSMAPFSITVAGATSPTNHAPTIAGIPSASATAGSSYSFQPSAADSEGDVLRYSVSNLPKWANFDTSTGLLRGTPGSSDIGQYSNIIVSVSDSQFSTALPAFSISVSAASAGVVNGAPRVLYTDLIAGPTSGGENDLGAYVSIFGKNFGTNLNQVRVYFGNVEAAAYRYLGASRGRSDIQQIIVQPGPVGTGKLPIKVVVNGVNSNSDNMFTVNPGDILFVDNVSGNDSSAIKNDITHAWRTVQSATQGGALGAAKPGDVIVLRGKATWKDVGFENRWFRFRTTTGSAPTGAKGSGYISIVAYPNEDVHYVAPANTNGGIHGMGDSYPQFADWIVISGLHIESSSSSSSDGAPINLQVKSDHWRVVNNELGPWPASSGAKAGGLVGNGTDVKALGNRIHDIDGGTENHCVYLDTGATNVEIAYNHIYNCFGGNIIQTFDNLGSGSLSGISIHHNSLHDGGRYGLNMSDGTVSIHAWNNLIYNTSFAGIRINQNGSALSQVYENNTLINVCTNHPAEAGAIQNTWNADSGSIVFRNNIVAKTQTACAQGYSDSSSDNAISLSRNLWFGYGVPVKDSQSLSGDPRFVNAAGANFHPQSGSPAIDASISAPINDDFDLDPRGVADLGALEQ